MSKYPFLFFFVFSANVLFALEVHPLFTDNMVLQQGEEISVWGWANAGSEVRVLIDDILKRTVVKDDGRWEVLLPPFPEAKRNLQLTIIAESEKIVFNNIAIGDVWLCAGQSNMAFQLYRSEKGESTIKKTPQYDIRYFNVPTNYSYEPLDVILPSAWSLNTSDELKNFSAVGYYFAEKIASEINIPIGLINNAVGGSAIESWMGADCFSEEWLGQYRDSIQELESLYYQETISKINYTPKTINCQIIFQDSFSFQHWKEMELPGRWEDKGYPFLDGTIYYVKDIELSQTPINDSTLLSLSTIDDADSVWVNGYLVGATQQWDALRHYVFPSELLKIGTNRILIKVMDHAGSGGVRGNQKDMYLAFSGSKIPLSGSWQFYINAFQLDSPWKLRHQPTLCHNALFHPIRKFPVKGILWYQGEANATTQKAAEAYGKQFVQLIQNWRKKYDQEALPFLYVQLPGYDDPRAESSDTWAILRQSQLDALDLPGTACASIIDLGEKNDIHPIHKKEVGNRLANLALNVCYGHTKNNARNPQLDSFQIVKDGILLHFENAGDGLLIKQNHASESANGFEIFDKKSNKHFASAKIIAPNTVKIEYERVEEIEEINYLWSNWNEHISLFNKNGLPAIPFQLKL